jgi:hypothetical protein
MLLSRQWKGNRHAATHLSTHLNPFTLTGLLLHELGHQFHSIREVPVAVGIHGSVCELLDALYAKRCRCTPQTRQLHCQLQEGAPPTLIVDRCESIVPTTAAHRL